jgi:cytochrome c oxidase assembly protein subunit 15
MSSRTPFLRGIHRLAVFLAGYVVLLITAGGLVKSLEAGLSVPDWPLSYGMLNPPRWWEIETVRAEHGHRLIAGTVLLLTLALVIWIVRREPRKWVRGVALAALAAVLMQAALGGITVLFFLPTAISVSHAGLAQLFLCLLVVLAVATSRRWVSGEGARDPAARLDRVVPLATATTFAVFFQIMLGAVMRHTGSGLAIPDFPLAFGGLIPPKLDFGIGIHFAHRVGALITATLIFWLLGRVLRYTSLERVLVAPASLAVLMVLIQGTLGGLVVLTGKAVLPNTLHVGGGALLLALSMVVTLMTRRLYWVAGETGTVAEAEAISARPLEQAAT